MVGKIYVKPLEKFCFIKMCCKKLRAPIGYTIQGVPERGSTRKTRVYSLKFKDKLNLEMHKFFFQNLPIIITSKIRN